MSENTTSEQFFEAKYRGQADPWDFATNAYEQGRYAATVAALEPRRFKRAFEPGCSVGILTEKLAAFCDRVEATDISPTAVERTRDRCRNLPNVTVAQGELPAGIPDGTFDLIVFSEVGYYFRVPALEALVASLAARLEPEGVFLAVHWLGSSPDHLLSGDQVHAVIGALPNLQLTLSERHEGFRLDMWIRHD